MFGIGNIGTTEFLVILAIALIFFGPRRLPSIANALGKSLREFRKALNEVKSEIAQADVSRDVADIRRDIQDVGREIKEADSVARARPTASPSAGKRDGEDADPGDQDLPQN